MNFDFGGINERIGTLGPARRRGRPPGSRNTGPRSGSGSGGGGASDGRDSRPDGDSHGHAGDSLNDRIERLASTGDASGATFLADSVSGQMGIGTGGNVRRNNATVSSDEEIRPMVKRARRSSKSDVSEETLTNLFEAFIALLVILRGAHWQIDTSHERLSAVTTPLKRIVDRQCPETKEAFEKYTDPVLVIVGILFLLSPAIKIEVEMIKNGIPKRPNGPQVRNSGNGSPVITRETSPISDPSRNGSIDAPIRLPSERR